MRVVNVRAVLTSQARQAATSAAVIGVDTVPTAA